MTAEDIASLILDRRQALGLSQDGLAGYVEGVDRSTISRWEQGEDLEKHIRLFDLLDVLGVELVCRPLNLRAKTHGEGLDSAN